MADSRWPGACRYKRQARIPTNRVLLLLALSLLLAACTTPVTIEWATEVEMDTAGFDIYRGESANGPFDVKVNDGLIPASPDPMAGGEYSFVDRTARAGRTYYYQLQELEAGGAVNIYGPIEVRAGWLDGRWLLGLGIAALGWALIWGLRSKRESLN